MGSKRSTVVRLGTARYRSRCVWRPAAPSPEQEQEQGQRGQGKKRNDLDPPPGGGTTGVRHGTTTVSGVGHRCRTPSGSVRVHMLVRGRGHDVQLTPYLLERLIDERHPVLGMEHAGPHALPHGATVDLAHVASFLA